MKIKFLTVLSLALVLFLGACGGKSDAELQTAADTALNGDPATADVTVTVTEGEATLTGEVANEADKATAESLAKVEGITSVKNNVTVAPAAPAQPAPTASGDDAAVKTKVEEGLKKNGCDGATVEVKDGVATLRGTVDTAKYEVCFRAASEAGAKRVINQLGKK